MKISAAARIIYNRQVSGEYRNMKIFAPKIAAQAVPGQFLNLQTSKTGNPILRRPMSIHKITQDSLEILYKVRGRGTTLLAGLKKGEKIQVMGPLGRGFDTGIYFTTAILVGGGYGISPLKGLHDLLKKQGKKIITITGAKTAKLVYKDGFTGVKVTTEDGSAGIKGLVTKALTGVCCDGFKGPAAVFACGPDKMLKAVAGVASDFDLPCQVSLENIMGCGIGVCLSCVCKTKRGMARVCVDGPVFNAKEIEW